MLNSSSGDEKAEKVMALIGSTAIYHDVMPPARLVSSSRRDTSRRRVGKRGSVGQHDVVFPPCSYN